MSNTPLPIHSHHGCGCCDSPPNVGHALVLNAYKAFVGDDVQTIWTVTHNLLTTDLVVSLWDVVNNRGILAAVDNVTPNSFTIDFTGIGTPSLNQYRVIVVAV